MMAHSVGSAWGRRSFLLVLTLVLGVLGVWDAGAADKAQWTRVLINRGRGDLEADAAGAVDGVKGGGFGFHTERQANPWWQVDLEQRHALDRVLVFNRGSAQERARYLVLLVSDDGVRWRDVYTHDGSVFGDSAGKKPLVIDLDGCEARFVRVQIRDNNWLHLSEVEVYGEADKKVNLARGRPARQSSVSTWSRRKPVDPATVRFDRDDIPVAREIIGELIAKAGSQGDALYKELQALVKADYKPDSPAWVSLYARASVIVEKKERIRTSLELLNIPALKRAIADLKETYPNQYARADQYLARLTAFEKELPELTKRLMKGDAQAEKRLGRIIALKREALLSNPLIDFDRLILIRRSANRLGLPANWQGNCSVAAKGYDNEIVTLSLERLDGEMERLYRPGASEFVGDIDLHFNADKMLFSMPGSHDRWQIWEMGVDGSDLRQVTRGEEIDVDNYDACYLPDGRIIYGSTAPMTGVPCVRGSSQVANLYIMDADGGNVRQLCFDQDHDWCPAVLNNGRVLYQRWEYTDTPHSNTRMLFHMNPDGTAQMEYYGSNSYWPNSIFYAKAVPDHPTKVVGIVTGHHGVARMGEMVIFDPAMNRHEASGVVQRIPGFGQEVEPVIKDQLVNDSWPKFLHPYPLSQKYFLVSAQPTPSSAWGVYLVDVFDNMLLLKEQPGYALLEPTAIKKTRKPPVVPDKVDLSSKVAQVYLVDVYAGPGLKGVPRGSVKQLRIFSYNYSFRGMGGLLGTVGMDGPWDIKRVLGTVPVEEDGSANFLVPANTPISVQPLDAEGKALQVMRSWMTAMPGEVLSCVGCHEHQNTTPPARTTTAANRRPSKIAPWYGPTRGFSFKREVQPVLDKYCLGCHNPDLPEGKRLAAGERIPDLRGTALIDDWSSVTPGNAGPDGGRFFSKSYTTLHRYVRRPGIESDYHLLTPLDFHADTTELVQLLKKPHHGVELDAESWDRIITWIDLNAPYHGYWHEIVGEERAAKKLAARQAELRERYAGIYENLEVIPFVPMPAVTPVMPVKTIASSDSTTLPVRTLDRETPGRQVTAGDVRRTVDLGGAVTLELVRLPAGQFVMGDSSQDGFADEMPRAVVNVARPFWIGRFEVSNEQYHRFDPAHDSRVESKHAYQFGVHGFPLNGPKQPVVRVSWQQAMVFCDWLSEKTGRKFSLPTEAQWEYACRAGSVAAFSFGDLDADFSPHANLADKKLREFADNPYEVYVPLANATNYDDWIPRDDRFNDEVLVSSEVGRYRANRWGLHDMHGNVHEWTRTSYQAYPYRKDDGRNDLNVTTKKVARGGSWYDRPIRARSAFRLAYRPYQRVFNVGFRVICEDADQPAVAVSRK